MFRKFRDARWVKRAKRAASFPYPAGVIVVLNKRKPAVRKNKFVLLNASSHVQKGRPKNFIPENDIRPLAAAFLKGEPVEGEVAVLTREQTEEADFNLIPSRWVGTAPGKDEADLKDILDHFASVVADEAKNSRNLEVALCKLRALT